MELENEQEPTNATDSFAAFLALWGRLGKEADGIKEELTELSWLLRPLCEVKTDDFKAKEQYRRVQKAFWDQSYQWNYVCVCAKVAYTNKESGQKCWIRWPAHVNPYHQAFCGKCPKTEASSQDEPQYVEHHDPNDLVKAFTFIQENAKARNTLAQDTLDRVDLLFTRFQNHIRDLCHPTVGELWESMFSCGANTSGTSFQIITDRLTPTPSTCPTCSNLSKDTAPQDRMI